MSDQLAYIDRDAIRRESFCRALAAAGFYLTQFESGRPAVHHLLTQPVHGVIVDWGSSHEPKSPLPAGKRVVQEITRADAFVPLILLCDRSEVLEHDTSAATDIVLRYPVPTRQLVDTVKGVLSETLRERVQRKSGYIFAFR